MLRRLLKSWREVSAAVGGRTAWLYAAAHVVARATGNRVRVVPYAFVAQPIGSPALATVRDDPGTSVVEVRPSDDAVVREFPRPAAVIRWRFESGARCHVAKVKGRFAGYIWTRLGGYEEDEVRCRYVLAEPSIAVWDFDVYVAPAYRAGRTLARLWKAVDRALQTEGVRWSYSRISLFNRGSLAAHERLGARRVATGVFIAARAWQFAWFSCRPYVHVTFRSTGQPTLVLEAPRIQVQDGAPPRGPLAA